jgi:hypothetical protein
MKAIATFAVCTFLSWCNGLAQSADWQSAVWREPQVRYLLCDMTLGGNIDLYRDYAKGDDPDSREAIRLWDAGARVVNTNDFERRWVTNRFGKDGRVMRIVLRGTARTIHGTEVLLTTDGECNIQKVRAILLDLSLGAGAKTYEARRAQDPEVTEALRRWQAGTRVLNAQSFERRGSDPHLQFRYRATGKLADISRILLNTDLPYPETNVRYFMADIALGGSLEFYRTAAERAHELGCLEAVRRTEDGYKITNLDQFERKKVNGQTVITRKGSEQRISGMEIKLSSD